MIPYTTLLTDVFTCDMGLYIVAFCAVSSSLIVYSTNFGPWAPAVLHRPAFLIAYRCLGAHQFPPCLAYGRRYVLLHAIFSLNCLLVRPHNNEHERKVVGLSRSELKNPVTFKSPDFFILKIVLVFLLSISSSLAYVRTLTFYSHIEHSRDSPILNIRLAK
jgi:hypothetical protein